MAALLDSLKGVKVITKADGSTAYQVTVSKGIDPRTGKQRRRYKTFTPAPGMTKREIKQEIERLRVEMGDAQTNTNSREARKSFVIYANDLIDRRERSGQYKSRTAASYRSALAVIGEDFGNMPLSEITPEAIEAFYDHLRRSGSRRAGKTVVAKSGLRQYLKEHKITGVSLAEESGIAQSTLRRALAGESITKDVASRISKALGKKTSDLFAPNNEREEISERTIQIYQRFIGAVFRSALKKGLIKTNPVAHADPPIPEKKEARFLTTQELAKVFECLENEPLRWKLIVNLIALTGARRGEIAGLQWSDVNFNDSTITIRHSLNYTADKGIFLDSTKTRARRTVKIPPEVVSLLRQYRAEQSQYILSCCGQYDNQGFLFTQPDGKPSNPETITSWFCRFSKRYGLNGVHAHSFRHSAASLMIANGVDVVTVSSILGHADPTTTERVYAHALEEVKVRASECLANAIYKRA